MDFSINNLSGKELSGKRNPLDLGVDMSDELIIIEDGQETDKVQQELIITEYQPYNADELIIVVKESNDNFPVIEEYAENISGSYEKVSEEYEVELFTETESQPSEIEIAFAKAAQPVHEEKESAFEPLVEREEDQEQLFDLEEKVESTVQEENLADFIENGVADSVQVEEIPISGAENEEKDSELSPRDEEGDNAAILASEPVLAETAEEKISEQVPESILKSEIEEVAAEGIFLRRAKKTYKIQVSEGEKSLFYDESAENAEEVPHVSALIDKFLEKAPTMTPLNPFAKAPEPVQSEDVYQENEIVTETMAKLHELQGNIRDAIRVYQKLSLRNPEKSSYFAERISTLQQKL